MSEISDIIDRCYEEKYNKSKNYTFNNDIKESNFNFNNNFNFDNDIKENELIEINYKLEKIKLKLKALQNDLSIVLEEYCNEHEHKYYLISKEPADSMFHTENWQTTWGPERSYLIGEKCSICGAITYVRGSSPMMLGVFGEYNKPEIEYEYTIPDDIYNYIDTFKDNDNFEIIKEKISEMIELIKYTDYLNSMKSILCETFGHNLIRASRLIRSKYECKCCGEIVYLENKKDNNIDKSENLEKSLTLKKYITE